MPAALTLVEVGPRDGFQVIKPFIPTEKKIALCRALVAAGVQRLEMGAFVSPSAIPQMADVREVLAALREGPHPELSALVPNRRGAEDALKAGMETLVYVVSASESHNRSNVRRSVADSMTEMVACLTDLSPRGRFRFNLATAFHCPFEGPTAEAPVLAMIDRLLAVRPDAEIGLCDTTGYASPEDVTRLVGTVRRHFGPDVALAYHAHDTYGFGVASVMAAWDAGIRVIDAAIAGLGGCPFAPGASGNVATEDLAYAFARRGIATGLDRAALIEVAGEAAGLDGAQVGGHIRTLIEGRRTAARDDLWRDPCLP
jgi:hydroxymethylglutaryl-CoA lyase